MSPECKYISTKEIAFSPRRGRSFHVYAEVLGYKGRERELSGKTILDVGAGDSDFAEKAAGYGAQVVRLDPRYDAKPGYLTEEECKLYQYSGPAFRKDVVAGIAQQLPFKDKSFDEVAALHSSYWIRTGLIESISEMLRVTKDNGTVTIWPAKIKSTDDLPSCIGIRKINPDYGCPTPVIITKDPEVSLGIIEEKIAPMIAASEMQYIFAQDYAKRSDKPSTTGPWRNC